MGVRRGLNIAEVLDSLSLALLAIFLFYYCFLNVYLFILRESTSGEGAERESQAGCVLTAQLDPTNHEIMT